MLAALTSWCLSAQSVALNVSAGSGNPGATVTLSIGLNATTTSPAGVEWTLKYATADITSATTAAGSVATAAGKQLSCKSSAGSSSCLLWGLNSKTMSNGVVATVALVISSTTKNSSSSIQLVSGVSSNSSGKAITTSTTGATLSIVNPGNVQVSLASVFNRIGIVKDGTTFTGGLNGSGNAYSSNLLGSTINENGSSFTFASPNVLNAATSVTVPLPASQFSSLAMLGTAVNGAQQSQTFSAQYTDGSSATFKQSLSDWGTSQNYTGESEIASMAYNDTSTGTKQIRTSYLYRYLFALDKTKTVKAFLLPNNGNVLLLAITLTAVAQSPDFSVSAMPATQSIPAGSSTSYTATAMALSGFSGAVSLSASGLPAGAAATFSPASLNGSGSSTVNVSTLSTTPAGTYTVTVKGTSGSLSHTASTTLIVNPASDQVNLTSAYNRLGIAADGTTFTGGLDSGGDAYSANLLGSTLTFGGALFLFGPANALDTVSSTTVVLPASEFSTLALLGAAVNGNQASQTFTVTYTDGTKTSFTQSLSDWHTPQSYSGETEVKTMAYRNISNGTEQIRTFYVCGYSFALNKTKTVKSVTLPNNSNVVVLAMTLVP